jgi:hypothetical protein
MWTDLGYDPHHTAEMRSVTFRRVLNFELHAGRRASYRLTRLAIAAE